MSDPIATTTSAARSRRPELGGRPAAAAGEIVVIALGGTATVFTGLVSSRSGELLRQRHANREA